MPHSHARRDTTLIENKERTLDHSSMYEGNIPSAYVPSKI